MTSTRADSDVRAAIEALLHETDARFRNVEVTMKSDMEIYVKPAPASRSILASVIHGLVYPCLKGTHTATTTVSYTFWRTEGV